MEKQREKNTEHEMDAENISGLVGIVMLGRTSVEDGVEVHVLL